MKPGVMARLTVLCAALMASACASLSAPPEPVWAAPSRVQLLSGELLFGEPLPELGEPVAEVLAVDDEMQQFLEPLRRSVGMMARHRLQGLIRALDQSDRLHLDYAANKTLTARQTFATGAGNCLSFTNLFIAMARELGLPAEYQLVDVPAMVERADDVMLVYRHINVRVNFSGQRYYEVDFNREYQQGQFPRRTVSDEHALSLYYSNLAAEALQRAEQRRSFALLRRAISIDPEAVGPWINLGVIYRRAGHPAAAEASYLQALQLDRGDATARYNLMRLYESAQNPDAAERMRADLKRIQRNNPYYHYEQSQRFLANEQWREAIPLLLEAIRLHPRDARFYAGLALAQRGVGEVDAARRNLQRAERLSLDEEQRARYQMMRQGETAPTMN